MRKWIYLINTMLLIFPCLSYATGNALNGEQFFAFISNPNIAYLLLLIAVYGLFFEFANPGLILPGLIGIIALILALYTFHFIPINYAGLTLILTGITFIVFEAYIPSYGVAGVAGIIAFIMGSFMLFDMNQESYRITWILIIAMSTITATFFFIGANIAIRSHKKSVITGKEGLIGSEGVVLSVMNEQVIVRVLGEIWEAKSPIMLNPQQKIKVIKIEGLILFVEPIK